MKRLPVQLMPCTLAALVSTVAGWCVVLYANHGSLYFRCGLLPTANDEYLDGSHRTFQQCTWHLGNSTRTWGGNIRVQGVPGLREYGSQACQPEANSRRSRGIIISPASGKAFARPPGAVLQFDI